MHNYYTLIVTVYNILAIDMQFLVKLISKALFNLHRSHAWNKQTVLQDHHCLPKIGSYRSLQGLKCHQRVCVEITVSMVKFYAVSNI